MWREGTFDNSAVLCHAPGDFSWSASSRNPTRHSIFHPSDDQNPGRGRDGVRTMYADTSYNLNAYSNHRHHEQLDNVGQTPNG